MIVVTDIIREIVNKTAESYGKPVYYSDGHIKEICMVLSSYSKTQKYSKEKYPRVMLLRDFAERINTKKNTTTVNLQLLIVTGSNDTYRAEDRTEKVFKTILYPIYECFIQAVKESVNIAQYDYSHNKIDRLALSNALEEAVSKGKQVSLLNDHLDGIEITNLKLELIEKCSKNGRRN